MRALYLQKFLPRFQMKEQVCKEGYLTVRLRERKGCLRRPKDCNRPSHFCASNTFVLSFLLLARMPTLVFQKGA